MSDPIRVLSYGGGTQSAALALMSAAGDLPRVDHVIFADTHGELPETYLYADYVERVLAEAGIPFHRVSAGSLEEALLSPVRTSSNPTPPSHVLNPDGSKGRVSQYRCSYDYKRRVIERKVKELCGGRGAWKRANVEQWLGFSVDELNRCKPDQGCRCGHNRVRPPRNGEPRGHVPACTDCACEKFDPWRVNVYPLIDLQYRREDTIEWFGKNGHPTPPRSACWFCPNARNPRWAALKAEHPDLFERACQLDEHIRNGGAFNRRGHADLQGQLFLHEDRIPLREADLRSATQKEIDEGQVVLLDELVLANDCEAGVCFT